MNKKAIVITENDKVIEVIEIKTFTDESSYAKLCKQAHDNKSERDFLVSKKAALKERFYKAKSHKQDLQITCLIHEVRLLKGEISEEEYKAQVEQAESLIKECDDELIRIESEAREYGLE